MQLRSGLGVVSGFQCALQRREDEVKPQVEADLVFPEWKEKVVGVTGHPWRLWKEQVKTEFRTMDDRVISVANYMACGTRTDVARTLGSSILEAPSSVGESPGVGTLSGSEQ